MTKLTAEMNRSTVHALSPLQSCRDRGRQSFIFHTKRHLGHIARTTLRSAFDRVSSHRAGDGADSDAFSAMQVL